MKTMSILHHSPRTLRSVGIAVVGLSMAAALGVSLSWCRRARRPTAVKDTDSVC